jgi:hypothetical protein
VLKTCLGYLGEGDTLVVTRLDRGSFDLRPLSHFSELTQRAVEFKVGESCVY